MKKLIMLPALLINSLSAMGADMSNGADNFYTSDKVTVRKVSFKNQYDMKVVGNLFVPKGLNEDAKNRRSLSGIPWAR